MITLPRSDVLRTRLNAIAIRRKLVLALGLLYVSWGSTYVAFKVTFEGLPPLLSTGTRFTIAGLIILAVARRGGNRMTNVRPEHLASAAILGFLMVGLGTGAVVVAVKHLTTGTTALVQASVPIWVALGDRVVFGTRFSRRALVGLSVGFVGIIALAGVGHRGPSNLVWVGLVVLGSIGWAAGALVSRVLPVLDDKLAATGLQMALGGVMVALVGLAGGDVGRIHLDTLRNSSILAWFYLLFVSALIGFSLYMWLLRVAPPTLVATSSYVDPVMALFFGWLLLGEGLSARAAVSAMAIVAGAALIVTAPHPTLRTGTDFFGEPGTSPLPRPVGGTSAPRQRRKSPDPEVARAPRGGEGLDPGPRRPGSGRDGGGDDPAGGRVAGGEAGTLPPCRHRQHDAVAAEPVLAEGQGTVLRIPE
jgi:drug/metabolite transporter (DMT)-like permease